MAGADKPTHKHVFSKTLSRDILESLNLVERQDGEVWKTSAGTWAGKRDGKTQYGLSGKEKAQAYVAGKDVKGDPQNGK